MFEKSDERSIFQMVETLIRKNHSKYPFSSVRVDSTVRNFRGVSSEVLLSSIKDMGRSIVDNNSKPDYSSYTSSTPNVFYFIDKDMVAVKYRYLPEIILARYFFQCDDGFMIICNCCYRDLYKGTLNTFDIVLHVQNQSTDHNYKYGSYSKITLISKGTEKIELGSDTKTLYPMLSNYGTFYVIYSLFIYLIHVIVVIKRCLKIAFSDSLDIEKLFIENFLLNLDTNAEKKLFGT